MNFVLAIDDNPERYADLSRKFREINVTILPAQNPEAVKMLLASGLMIRMIILDHDMPAVDYEGQVTNELNGSYYLREVLPTSIPVVVSSANTAGRAKMLDLGAEYGFDITPISVIWKGYSQMIYDHYILTCG
jgi:CheY-like chemotaxis protein